mgnify:CR=1 FL=1
MKRFIKVGLKQVARGLNRIKIRTAKKTGRFCKKHQLVNQPIQAEEVPVYSYFTQARSWTDDFYTTVEASRNRWRALSLWILTPVVFLLLLCVAVLTPIQHLVPLMVNHYNNGLVTVTPFHETYAPKNQAQVESDITRYVRFREGYSANTYQYSYRLISLMSSPSIKRRYDHSQSSANKHAPINVLGNKRYRTVKIQSIVFLDTKGKNSKKNHTTTHRNLAQIDFVVTDHDIKSGTASSMPLTVLISWGYRGMPNNPSDRWMNWNGFSVSTYQVHQRNVS